MAERKKPEHREVTLTDPSYQPTRAELREDLRLDATFEELTTAVVRPVKIRYAMPGEER